MTMNNPNLEDKYPYECRDTQNMMDNECQLASHSVYLSLEYIVYQKRMIFIDILENRYLSRGIFTMNNPNLTIKIIMSVGTS